MKVLRISILFALLMGASVMCAQPSNRDSLQTQSLINIRRDVDQVYPDITSGDTANALLFACIYALNTGNGYASLVMCDAVRKIDPSMVNDGMIDCVRGLGMTLDAAIALSRGDASVREERNDLLFTCPVDVSENAAYHFS